jgi:hypothetical protein
MSLLLSRETIKIMMKVQRLVRDEFGVRIGLDDDNASAMLLAYASRSQSEELRLLSGELAVSIIPGARQEASNDVASDNEKVKQRVYRGRVIMEEEVSPSSEQAVGADSTAKKGVVYRGNVVAA